MGITEWASRDAVTPQVSTTVITSTAANTQEAQASAIPEKVSDGTWWFFGNKPQGEAAVLFQNMIRVLGLSLDEWSWINPSNDLNALELPQNGLPTIEFVFGGPAAQK